MEIKADITAKAREVGFDTVGFAPARVGVREQARLDEFVAIGEHGEMAWMAETHERRRAPTALWHDVKSVIVLGTNYGPAEDPLDLLTQPDRANISAYARNKDYHDLVKKRLKQVARWMVGEYGGDLKVFVDTAPVMEKPLAALAGLGWQGKHSNLVSREFGSWLFLGEIYTTLDLPPDAPGQDKCGSCRACLDICPTDAFPAPYKVDARRCISYLTIEHKGPIPHAFRKPIGNRIYGCDDCLAVCPWNKFARPTKEPAFLPREAVDNARLRDFLALDDATFREVFRASPVKRIGRDRFLRNVLIACGNSGDPSLLPAIENLLGDQAPVIRGAAVWALSQLQAVSDFRRTREARLTDETDPDVIMEWNYRDRDA